MIIGITGGLASGKDAAAVLLEDYGFRHISLSDLLREELEERRISLTRDNLIQVGNQLRKEHGPDYLAQKAFTQMKDDKHYVITSIRTTAEVERFIAKGEFIFLRVTAPIKIRLDRLRKRDRENDPKTLEELKAKEELENTDELFSQQMNRVAALTNIEIVNDGTLDEFEQEIQTFVESLKLTSLVEK